VVAGAAVVVVLDADFAEELHPLSASAMADPTTDTNSAGWNAVVVSI
jgi:hypothetical protein